MNGPLNTVPRGLLGLFGLKGPQDGLRTLGDEVRPVIELANWMADGNGLQFISQSINATIIQTYYLNQSVPAGKAWLVRNAYLQSAETLAGEMIRFRLGVRRANLGGYYYTNVGEVGYSDPNDAVGVGVALSRMQGPFLMLPGDGFIGVVERVTTAGTIAMNLVGLLYEFDWQS